MTKTAQTLANDASATLAELSFLQIARGTPALETRLKQSLALLEALVAESQEVIDEADFAPAMQTEQDARRVCETLIVALEALYTFDIAARRVELASMRARAGVSRLRLAAKGDST